MIFETGEISDDGNTSTDLEPPNMPDSAKIDQAFSLRMIEQSAAKLARFKHLKTSKLEKYANWLLNGPGRPSIEACDLVQEAFAGNPNTVWDNETHFLKDMYTRIQHAYCDFLKRKNAQKRPKIADLPEQPSIETLAVDPHTPSREIDQERLYEQLSGMVFLKLFDIDPPDLGKLGEYNPTLFHDFISALKALQEQEPYLANVVWLRIIGELTWSKIAAELDRSEEMVRRHYWPDACSRLRRSMKRID